MAVVPRGQEHHEPRARAAGVGPQREAECGGTAVGEKTTILVRPSPSVKMGRPEDRPSSPDGFTTCTSSGPVDGSRRT